MVPRSRRSTLVMLAVLLAAEAAAQTPTCSFTPTVIARKITRSYKGASIGVSYPEIAGEPAFNAAVLAEIRGRVNGVKHEADIDAKDPPPSGRRGSIGSTFSVTHTRSGIVSVLISYGLDGSMSVHPWEEMTSYNYDLCNHRLVRLGDLFLPHSHYLSTLSKISIKSLEGGEYADTDKIRIGASPRLQNFATFTLDEENLTIYFQQYQVAAGAAGSTSVKIPWKDLKPILRKRYLQ